MNKDKISIVVPVYNTEKYVGQCIESIIQQDYKNLELVLVNDGSKDNSLQILQRYKEKYLDNIIVIDKPNEGVDKARRAGLDHITGEYVMFVDSDDKLVQGAISILYNTLIDNKVDVVSAEFKRFGFIIKKQSKLQELTMLYYDRKIESDELMHDIYKSFLGINILNVSMCGKIYKSSLFKEWKPVGLRFGEDLVTNMRIFPKIKSMYIIKDRLYNYRVGGITGHYMPFFLQDCKKLYNIKKNELIKQEYQKGFRYIVVELKNELKTHIEQLLFYQKVQDADWLKTEFEDCIYDDFDWYLKDGYKHNNDIDDAIYHRDAERTLSLMKADYNPLSLRNIVKRIITWIA